MIDETDRLIHEAETWTDPPTIAALAAHARTLRDERNRLAADVERLTVEDPDEDERWCDECGDYHGPTPRAVGAFGGEAPTAEAVLAERRATEEAIAPLRSVDGVADVEVLVEYGAECRTVIHWTRNGVAHGLAAAFGAGRELARLVVAGWLKEER